MNENDITFLIKENEELKKELAGKANPGRFDWMNRAWSAESALRLIREECLKVGKDGKIFSRPIFELADNVLTDIGDFNPKNTEAMK